MSLNLLLLDKSKLWEFKLPDDNFIENETTDPAVSFITGFKYNKKSLDLRYLIKYTRIELKKALLL